MCQCECMHFGGVYVVCMCGSVLYMCMCSCRKNVGSWDDPCDLVNVTYISLTLFLQDHLKTLAGLESKIDDIDGLSMDCVKTDGDVIQQRIADLR